MVEISDYSKLTEAQKKALAKLLINHRGTNVFSVGTLDGVRLHHRIIKHLSSGIIRHGVKAPRIRYEVMDNQVFSKGSNSTYYKSLYTLSLDEKDNLLIKKRKPDRLRLVKEQMFSKSNSLRTHRIRSEALLMQRCGLFHSKQLEQQNLSLFIVMRELPGITLQQVLKGEMQLSIRDRFDLSLALLNALKTQIHDNACIHRNIKPEKILVNQTKNGFELYIIGFGMAKDIAYDDSEESLINTQYSAPESNLIGFNTNDKCDIYSMGIVLSYLWSQLKAVPAEYHDHYPALTERVESAQEIQDIIMLMCQADHNQRPNLLSLIELFTALDKKLAVTKRLRTRSGLKNVQDEDEVVAYGISK